NFRTVSDHEQRILARTRNHANPTEVRKNNQDTVTDILAQAGVPYFFVNGTSPLRTVLGIPDTYRDTVLRELHTALRHEGAYVRHASTHAFPTLLNDRRRLRKLSGAAALQVYLPVSDPRGWLVLGRTFSCEIEFWSPSAAEDGELIAPRRNRVTPTIQDAAATVKFNESAFTRLISSDDTTEVPTAPEFAVSHIDDVNFPVDAVYTWVDGSDPDWLEKKRQALTELGSAEDLNELAANNSRYLDRSELRYSLRSLYHYAPWIRHIFLVTDQQVPHWLTTEHPDITIVSHQELFGDTGKLPTFNSHAIESRLHRIPGLAEHFLYLNDDVFLGRPLTPEHFFHSNGVAKFFLSTAQVEPGPPTAEAPPVLAAGKNNRDLVSRARSLTLTQKMKHVPHAQRLSVLQELEQRFPDEFEATARHQFRHPGDISIPSSLQHYWSYVTGRAVPD